MRPSRATTRSASPEVGVAAVDLEALLPPTEALERAGLSAAGVIGPRAQELVATAIGRLVRPDRPIVVFTHAQSPGTLLGEGAPFHRVRERLREREIDAIEWAALEQIEPPDLSQLDPAGLRPAVFVVISPDSTAGSGAGRLTGAQRARDLANTVQALLDAGEPVLLNLNPSVYPTYGDADPLAALVAPFGITPRTGTTLLTDVAGGPQGRRAGEMTEVVAQGGDHAIADAVRGLRVLMPWAVPVDIAEPAPGDNARAWPILGIGAEQAANLWAESRWLRLWSTPANARAMLTDQPVFNQNDDERREGWVLGAAAERSTRFGPSRVVVMGSNGWCSDGAVMGAAQLVDGRVTTRYPGNGVLLDGAIHWLAGLEELIAPGADARPVATVKPLGPGPLSTLRWVLLGVTPGLILVAGGAYRALRG